MPNCRLQTLETFICGRVREGDVPSSHVPSTYAASLSQADPRARARTLAPVVHHNALDDAVSQAIHLRAIWKHLGL